MGSTNAACTQAQFNQHWKISDKSVDYLTIWENKHNPSSQLEQYYVSNYEESRNSQLQIVRKNYPHIVSAYTIDKERFACCQDQQGNNVYVERIPLRLSNIEDIPYPDIIHLFNACIVGFQKLAEMVGFFRVDEDQIGINLQAQAKVWLNVHFESNQVLGSREVKQGQMIQDILQILFKNSDHDSYPPNIPNLLQYIGPANQETTFQQISDKFAVYTKKYSQSYIPVNLQCVHYAGGVNEINSWCRNNSSFGFQPNSERLQKNLFQSKMVREQLNESKIDEHKQYEAKVQNSIQPEVHSSQILVAMENNPATKTGNIIQTQILPRQQTQIIAPQPTQNILPQQPQLIPQQQQSQIIPQQQVQIIRQQQGQIVPQQQRVFHHPPQQFSRPFLVDIPPQNPQIQLPQAPQPQINRIIPNQLAPLNRKIQIIQQRGGQQFYSQNRPQQIIQQLPVKNVVANNNVDFKPIVKQASRKQIITQAFPQAESRLQQQRVISQTIEVKENPVQQVKDNSNERYTDYKNSSSGLVQAWRNQAQKEVSQKQEVLNSYGRAIPHSINVNEQRYNTTDDGKSSPDFLSLLRQLKGDATNEDSQPYSYVKTTPNSNLKDEAEISKPQPFNYTSYTSYNGQKESSGLLNSKFQSSLPQEFKYSGQYSFSKYDRTIDPELEADLNRYK